ncbi:hypothetical protein D3C73_947280 [compost metagenome]
MAPFGGKPGVVVVEPAHDATDVPRRLDGIEPKRRAGHARAVWHHRAFDQRPQVFGAFGKTQRQQATAQGIHQAVAGGVQGLGRLDLEVEDVIGNVLQDLVVVRAIVQVNVGAHVRFTREVVR